MGTQSSPEDQANKANTPDRSTPQTAAELASIQRDDECRLCHGIDMTTQARALVLYAEELQLSIFDLMCVGYALLRNAEGGLDALVKEERDRGARRCDFDALYMWSMTSGGLTSVRMTLRAMLETPTDPGLWKSCPPWGHVPAQQPPTEH